MDKLKVGIVGLGQRGEHLIRTLFVYFNEIEITGICDLYSDRTENVADTIEKETGKRPLITSDYKDLVTKELVDCILIMTPWDKHVEMSVYCMEKGIPCGSEIGGAETLEECFALVEAYERTKTPFMFLENCCYGRRELMVLNMAKQGVLGEIVHCSGGYLHDLRDEVAFGKEKRHYRLNEYLTRNCENYPTHEIGPIARVLDINRGNSFVSLTATASKSAGLHEYVLENKSDDKELVNTEFAQGDIITTVIKCARGETVTLTLDTTLPRYYSRGFTVRGTKGMYEEATDSVFLDSVNAHDHWNWKKHWGNVNTYFEKYDDEIWKKYIKEGIKGAHDGIDYLIYKDFFKCVKENKPMPIDVYDAAVWMCIAPLSAKSIAGGSVPVEFPDFKSNKL